MLKTLVLMLNLTKIKEVQCNFFVVNVFSLTQEHTSQEFPSLLCILIKIDLL